MLRPSAESAPIRAMAPITRLADAAQQRLHGARAAFRAALLAAQADGEAGLEEPPGMPADRQRHGGVDHHAEPGPHVIDDRA